MEKRSGANNDVRLRPSKAVGAVRKPCGTEQMRYSHSYLQHISTKLNQCKHQPASKVGVVSVTHGVNYGEPVRYQPT